MIPSECGLLEGMFYQNNGKNKSLALLLHPHPVYKGSMNNKIVMLMTHVFCDLDFDVLRINFRGVGKSHGKFDDGKGEVTDALEAIDWLFQQYRDQNINHAWIGGFGFGALIGLQAVMRRPDVTGFISISPPDASLNSINTLTPCPNGLLVSAENDHHVSPHKVEELANSLYRRQNASIEYKCIEDENHYFSYHTDKLYDVINLYLCRQLGRACSQDVHMKYNFLSKVQCAA